MGRLVGLDTREIQTHGNKSWAPARWHADGARSFPSSFDEFRNINTLIDQHLLDGLTPEQPVIDQSSKIVTMGSCFASEMRQVFATLGLDTGALWVPSGLNNSFAVRDFVEWCTTGTFSSAGYSYDRAEDGDLKDWLPDDAYESYRTRFEQAGLFIITLGLSEVWRHRTTGKVFWLGVPDSIYDADLHSHELSTVEENARNIEEIYQLIRTVNPSATVVFTLSPVPLKATFRDMSCIAADSVSKSILRVALDCVQTKNLPGFYYFPSYEVVRTIAAYYNLPAFGAGCGRTRHVSRKYVYCIILAFIRAYAHPAFYDRIQKTFKAASN